MALWFSSQFLICTTAISHIEEYLILSMEIPSDPKDIKATVYPDEFIVDSVKVYKKKSEPQSPRDTEKSPK